MFVQGISTKDFSKNCLGGTSNKSLRMRTMTVSGELSNNSPRRVVQHFYRNSVVSFQKQKAGYFYSHIFTGYFYSHIGLAMCEGVGEDSRHGFGHVDIQVGS